MDDLPVDVREGIEKISDPALRGAVERAARVGLSPEKLAEARRLAGWRDERDRAQRQDYLLKIADAALDGQFGADAKTAVSMALRDGRTWEALERAGRIVAEAKRRGGGARAR